MEPTYPNLYLDNALAFYTLQYLRQIGTKKTGSRINQGSYDFLDLCEIDPSTEPSSLEKHRDLVYSVASEQKRVLTVNKNSSLRAAAKEKNNDDFWRLIAHGGQSMFLRSYSPLNQNLFGVDSGLLTYGYKKDVYRDIVENVLGAGFMFARASKIIGQEFYKLHGGTSNISIIEFGAGQGFALLNFYLPFLENGFFPFILPTDLDEATEDQVDNLFRVEHKLQNVPWLKVDMENRDDVASAVNEGNHKAETFLTSHFIGHETESILRNFLESASTAAPKAKIILTDFLLPSKKTKKHPNYPRYFETQHFYSNQHLRGQDQILDIAWQFGYKPYHDTLVHHKVNDEPIVATFFLSK